MGQYFSGDEDNPSFSVGDPGNHIKSNRFAGKPWDSIPGKGCGWSIMQTAASKKCILHFQPVGFVLYIFLEVAQTSQPQRKGRETSTKSEQRQLLSQLRDVSNLYATKKERKKKKNDCCSHFPWKMWRKSLSECMVGNCKLFYARQLNEAWITTSLVWMCHIDITCSTRAGAWTTDRQSFADWKKR